MNTSTDLHNVSITHYFVHQLERFCRGEHLSQADTRNVSNAVVERVSRVHGGSVIFSPEGCKVEASAKLANGELVRVLVVFEETQGIRTILKIAAARRIMQPAQDKP